MFLTLLLKVFVIKCTSFWGLRTVEISRAMSVSPATAIVAIWDRVISSAHSRRIFAAILRLPPRRLSTPTLIHICTTTTRTIWRMTATTVTHPTRGAFFTLEQSVRPAGRLRSGHGIQGREDANRFNIHMRTTSRQLSTR